MGAASYLEDLEDRRIEASVLRGVSQFEEHQLARLRAGTLSEHTLRHDLDILRQRVVEPLEAIKAKAGAQDVDLGNELLKLQSQINVASSSMAELLNKMGPQPSTGGGKDDALREFLDSFVGQYRLLLRVLQAVAQLLNVDNRSKLQSILGRCEQDVRQLVSLTRRLAAREKGIGLLVHKVEALQKELDELRQPGVRGRDASGYEDFGEYTSAMGIKKLRQ